jgi:hypothetical protein
MHDRRVPGRGRGRTSTTSPSASPESR